MSVDAKYIFHEYGNYHWIARFEKIPNDELLSDITVTDSENGSVDYRYDSDSIHYICIPWKIKVIIVMLILLNGEVYSEYPSDSIIIDKYY